MEDKHNNKEGDESRNTGRQYLDDYAVVSCGTTKGPITIELYRYWSPDGYDKAVGLFESGYYDHCHFFRMIKNFLVQFGITYSSDPEVQNLGLQSIPDDPQLNPPIPFKSGTISFAGNGPNSRTSQLFIAFGPSSLGNAPWETPIGQIVAGMDNVNSFYSGYGDTPIQQKIRAGPNYIETNYPNLDKFITCQVQRKHDNPLFNNKEDEKYKQQTLQKDAIHVPLRRTVTMDSKQQTQDISSLALYIFVFMFLALIGKKMCTSNVFKKKAME